MRTRRLLPMHGELQILQLYEPTSPALEAAKKRGKKDFSQMKKARLKKEAKEEMKAGKLELIEKIIETIKE